jgi:hypothetical protein
MTLRIAKLSGNKSVFCKLREATDDRLELTQNLTRMWQAMQMWAPFAHGVTDSPAICLSAWEMQT